MKRFFYWFKSLQWYWKVGVIAVLIPIGLLAPDKKVSDSYSTHSTKYYKCHWCGKSVSEDEVITPVNTNSAQANVYTLENGFTFCSQECFREWRLRQ